MDAKFSVAPQHSYLPEVSSAPLYRYRSVNPVTPFIVSNTSPQSLIFETPSNVLNLSRSYLSFDLVVADAGALGNNNVLKVANSAINPIKQIIVRSNQSAYELCNLTNVQAYARTLPYELNDEELDKLYEIGIVAAAAPIQSNSFGWINSSPTATASQQQITSAGALITYDAVNVAVTKNINRLICGTVVAAGNGAGAFTVQYRIPMSLLKNTCLSLDKDVLFSGGLRLEFVMAPLSEYVTSGTAVADLAGAAALTNAQSAGVSIANPVFKFAVQENLAIAAQVEALVKSSGISLTIPYVSQTNYQTDGAATFSYTTQLRSDMGSYVHAVYNLVCMPTDSSVVRANNYNASDVQWSARRSSLNAKFLQDSAQTTYDEWMALSQNKNSGVLKRYKDYQLNSAILDRFDSQKSSPNALSGLPTDKLKPMDYTIEITKHGSQKSYWCMPIYTRQMHLSGAGVVVSV